MGRPRRAAGGEEPRDIRRQTLDVAERRLAEWGYAGMSMDDVARAVGVVKSTLYYHFPSKDALVLEVAKRAAGRDQQDLHAVQARAQTPRHQLELLIGALLSAGQRPHHDLHLKLREAARFLPPHHQQELYGLVVEQTLHHLTGVLRAGIEHGEFVPHDTDVTARALLGMLPGLADLARPPEALTQTVLDFVLHGIASPPHRRSTPEP